MSQASTTAADLAAFIRGLPELIAAHPILLWGFDPCDSNDICSVWFGPTTTRVTGIRRGYPTYQGIDELDDEAVFRTDVSAEKIHVASKLDAWARRSAVTPAQLIGFERWANGSSSWPHWLDPESRQLIQASIEQVGSARLSSVFEWSPEVNARLTHGLGLCVDHIQSTLRRNGMPLWADQPDKSFSFNLDAGELELVSAGKFQALIDADDATPSTEGMLWIGPGADLSGADLSGLKLHGADLTGADLTGAQLDGTDLSQVRFDAATRWPEGFDPSAHALVEVAGKQQDVIDEVRIPAGRFVMGDERRAHPVRLSRSYLMMDAPVTQALYKAVTGTNPSEHRDPEAPVENLAWLDAVKFANQLSERHGLEPCYSFTVERYQQKVLVDWKASGYRLPTEAEWERAARADLEQTGSRVFAGSGDWREVAWTSQNSDEKPQPVKLKKPNAWGLYDLSGNVFEWCWDWQGKLVPGKPCTDPKGPESGSRRACRGGYYKGSHRIAHLDHRHEFYDSDFAAAGFGVRLVRNAPVDSAAPPTPRDSLPEQLVGLDLSGRKLAGINLSGADLTGTKLSGAELMGADLSEAQLSSADFSGADLTGADLCAATVEQANFSGACLSGASLLGARADGAVFEGADLTDVDLRHASIDDSNLSGATLTRTRMHGMWPSDVDLRGARFIGTFLVNTDLSELDLGNAVFDGAELTGTDLSVCQLAGVDFAQQDLSGVRLRLARYSAQTRWPEGFDLAAARVLGPGCELEKADLSGEDLSGIDLSGASLVACDFMDSKLPGAQLQDARLSRACFAEADLTGSNLRNATLTGASFKEAVLKGADLTGATLGDNDFEGVHADGETRWPEGFTLPDA